MRSACDVKVRIRQRNFRRFEGFVDETLPHLTAGGQNGRKQREERSARYGAPTVNVATKAFRANPPDMASSR